jgi:hypothetical protein
LRWTKRRQVGALQGDAPYYEALSLPRVEISGFSQFFGFRGVCRSETVAGKPCNNIENRPTARVGMAIAKTCPDERLQASFFWNSYRCCNNKKG